MNFKVVVHCNDAVEVLPDGEGPFTLCSLLWSDMCEVAINVELKNPDARIWSKCLVSDDVFQAEFFIADTGYDYNTAKDAAREIGALLALTMVKTLLDVDEASIF